MKKYLITGITALAICFGFTSCSHDLDSLSQDEIDQLEAQKIVNTYQRAFKAYIGGEVAPTQNWGFGSIASARTRAIDEEGATFSHVEQPQKWSCPVNDLHFRDDKNKNIPVVEMPTFTHTVSDAVYADNITNWDNQKIISIDGKYTKFTTKDDWYGFNIGNADLDGYKYLNIELYSPTASANTITLDCWGNEEKVANFNTLLTGEPLIIQSPFGTNYDRWYKNSLRSVSRCCMKWTNRS